MRTKLLILTAALAAFAVPAGLALAEKFDNTISAHVNDDEDQIFGVVRSKENACEKRREVRLFGPSFENDPKRGQDGFERYAITKTNRFGEYRFFGFDLKRGRPGDSFPLIDGDYFARAVRKDFPNDLCRFANSSVVTISNNE